MPSKKVTFPQVITVYVCDYVEGEPIYAVVNGPHDIPESHAGETVAIYHLKDQGRLSVSKKLV